MAPLSRKEAITAGVIVVAAIMMILAEFEADRALARSGDAVARTQEVRATLLDLRSNLIRAQNATRGFALLGTPDSEAVWVESVAHARKNMQDLRGLAADKSSQQAQLTALEARAASFFGNLDAVIAARRGGGQAAALLLIEQRRDFADGLELRALVAAALAEEARQFDSYSRISAQKLLGAQLMAAALAVLIFGLMIGAYLLLRRDRSALAHARAGLESANALLEERIAVRTAEIERAHARIVLMFNAISDGACTLDADLRFTYINEHGARILGRDAAGMIGTPLIRDNPETRQFDITGKCARVLASGEPLRGEARIDDKRGSRLWYHIAPLPDGVIVFFRDVTRRYQQDMALREGAHRMQALNRKLIEAEENERRALSRELHDELGQHLAAIRMNLIVIARDSDGALRARADDTAREVEGVILQIRDRVMELRPSLLDDLGLAAAVEEYAARQSVRSGVAISVDAGELQARPTGALELTAFRLIQEAINNALRHAACRSITVALHTEDGYLHVHVQDDGRSFDPEGAKAAGNRLGIAGMRERVALLGGQLRIESRPGAGTLIRAALPVRAEAGAADAAVAT